MTIVSHNHPFVVGVDTHARKHVVAVLAAWFVPGLMEAVILGKDRCHECTEKVSR